MPLKCKNCGHQDWVINFPTKSKDFDVYTCDVCNDEQSVVGRGGIAPDHCGTPMRPIAVFENEITSCPNCRAVVDIAHARRSWTPKIRV